MTTSTQTSTHARKLGIVASAGSIAAVALMAAVLPPALVGILPVLALAVPFVAAGALEGALEETSAHA